MRPPKKIERFAKDASIKTSEAANEQVLQRMQEAYNNSARAPVEGRAGGWIAASRGRIVQLAVAALILVAAGVLFDHLLRPLGGAVAWAEVTRRFQAVPFFSAAIYMKEDATSEPTQMELWMSQDGRIRLRIGTQVVFARGGAALQAYDIKSRQPVEPDERARVFIGKINEAGELSLDAIIKVMFGGQTTEVTPLVNPDAVISQDMVVFDVEIPDTPEWVRIWALRESRLPVRITVWDPRDGETMDAIFTYSREQPAEFFDPNAFQTLLENRSAGSQVNVAYAFLTDPGGRNITPEEMFAQSGYHVPQVEQAGITPDGAVWVIAAKGDNRMPNGYSFFGFGKLEDDLGREYRRVYASHRTATDQSMEAFVPADYPFDGRVPGKLILVCEVDDYRPRARREVIGTVELANWRQGQSWPDGTIDVNERAFRTQMAMVHGDNGDFAKAEHILSTIQGRPEEDPAALGRERVRLRILVQQDKYAAAVALGERLMPLLEGKYQDWHGFVPTPTIFRDYVRALVYAGQLDEAKHVWQRIKNIEPQLHPGLSEAARAHIAEAIRHDFENSLLVMVPELSGKAHLTISQLNDIFGIDIKKDELFKDETFWDWNPEFEKPKYRNWERHLAELAEYYRSHPLPASMEILAHAGNEEYGGHPNKMPGVDGYEVHLLSGTLAHHALFYRYPESVGRVRVEPGVADVTFDHDLVYRAGTPWLQMSEFVLDSFGLEIVEVNEPRQVWVARHDARELKDYREVLAPVPHDVSPGRKVGTASSGSSGGFGVTFLFNDFMADQNQDARGDGILIVDETGINEKVSRESPCWERPEAIDMARKWFADEFGITFTEETRTMTTYVIRRKG